MVSETVARGRNAGLAVSFSPLLTDGPIIGITVLLLGRIEDSEPSLAFISLAGGALLASYGIAGLRGASPKLEEPAAGENAWGSLAKGVALNFLNPNPYLFWLTVGTPVLLRAHSMGWQASIGFLAIFYLCLVGSKCVLAILVGRSREVLHGRAYLTVNRILAVALLFFAAIFIRNGIEGLLG